jgi:uncharacterized protein YegL
MRVADPIMSIEEARQRLDDLIEFAENPEPRCACVLLLDVSRSMEGDPITALNEGVETFRKELQKDPIAARRVEVAIITFDSEVNVVQTFVTAGKFQSPQLTAQGFTCMGTGINTALDMIEERKALYKANGITYFRPCVLMMTDGEPHGEPDLVIQEATQRLAKEEKENRVMFYAVGVQNASMGKLATISVRPPIKLNGLDFQQLFTWLSASMSRVSRAQVGEQVPLPPPSAKEE